MIKVHRWCETQVLIGWNILLSHHESEYNFVFTPCKQSLCFTFSILSYSSKTHAASIEYDLCLACAACCLDTVWTSGLIAVSFVQPAHRSVMTTPVYQSETDARTLNTSLTRENKINKFRSSRFGDFKGLTKILPLTQ